VDVEGGFAYQTIAAVRAKARGLPVAFLVRVLLGFYSISKMAASLIRFFASTSASFHQILSQFMALNIRKSQKKNLSYYQIR